MKLSSALIALCFAAPAAVVSQDDGLDSFRQMFLRHAERARKLQFTFEPSVRVTNRVYLGSDAGKGCARKGVKHVDANIGDDIVYCFKVTNNGKFDLQNFNITNEVLKYTDTYKGVLPVGKSVLFYQATSMQSSAHMGPQVNTVVVKADAPVVASSSSGPVKLVSSDDSTVSVRSSYTPMNAPKVKSCLKDSWLDNHPTGEDLVCDASHVAHIVPGTMKSDVPMTCKAGTMISVNLAATIRVNTYDQLFDLGWHIAADGGDALSGACTVNALRPGNEYFGNEYGFIHHEEEMHLFGTPNDHCGEVVMMGEDGTGYDFVVPMGDVLMKCGDDNGDGIMKASVCLSWKTQDTDSYCTLDERDPNTKGKVADVFPGVAAGNCFCSTYDIPSVTVTQGKACH